MIDRDVPISSPAHLHRCSGGSSHDVNGLSAYSTYYTYYTHIL